MPDVRVSDCWVNVSVGSSRERAPDYAVRTAEGYFKRSKDFFKTFSAEELIASDHPVLPMDRCITEAKELDLREGVLDKFLYQNAERLFFAPRNPRY